MYCFFYFLDEGIVVDWGRGYGADADGNVLSSVEAVVGTPFHDVLISNVSFSYLAGQAGVNLVFFWNNLIFQRATVSSQLQLNNVVCFRK